MTAQPGATVTVIAGQWIGWTGTVLETLSGGHLWVRLRLPAPDATRCPACSEFVRALRPDEVEVRMPHECPTCHEEPGVVGEPCLSRGDLRDLWHDAAEDSLRGTP